MANTANLNITLPTPGVTTNWGNATDPPTSSTTAGVNYVINKIDEVFAAAGTGTSVGMQVGSGKTLLVGGTFRAASGSTVLMGADGASGTVTGNTIRAGNASGSDTVGGTLTIQGGNSTGNAAGGSILMQVAAAGSSSGTGSNTLRNVLRVESTNRVGVNTGSTAPAVTLDVGAGGSSGSATAQQNLRLNGSSAGDGTQGGSLLTIANNGTNTGAVGNYSAVMGGSTTYAADTTIASASTLRFFTGATIAGATAANEKLRIGTAGEIGIWDATLTTPAINFGTAGQVLTSGGSAAAPVWSAGGSVTSLGTVNTTSGTSATLSGLTLTSYKFLIISLNGVSHNNSGSRSINVSSSTTVNTGATITGSGDTAVNFYVQAFLNLANGAASGNSDGGLSGITTASTSVNLVLNGSGSFDAGSFTVFGLR